MRRIIIIIGTALAVLGAAGGAFAAAPYNNYTGSKLVFPAKAGTKAKPVGLSMTEILRVSTPPGKRAAPLMDVKLTMYGVKLQGGKLPVCTRSKILANKTNPIGGCPRNSLIGGGPVHSLLGPSGDPSSKGTVCNTNLNLFTSGPKRQILYFWTKSLKDCGGLLTGATAPWENTISYSGPNAVVNTPLPPDVSTKVANQPGLFGSLIGERLVFPKTVGGKLALLGIGCKNGKRPWSITFTARLSSGGDETRTVKGSSKC